PPGAVEEADAIHLLDLLGEAHLGEQLVDPALDGVAAVVRGDGVEQRSARTPRRLLLVGSRRGRHQDARGERERCEARQEASRQGCLDQAKKVPPSTDRATSPRIAALYAAGFTRSSGEPGGCRGFVDSTPRQAYFPVPPTPPGG